MLTLQVRHLNLGVLQAGDFTTFVISLACGDTEVTVADDLASRIGQSSAGGNGQLPLRGLGDGAFGVVQRLRHQGGIFACTDLPFLALQILGLEAQLSSAGDRA